MKKQSESRTKGAKAKSKWKADDAHIKSNKQAHVEAERKRQAATAWKRETMKAQKKVARLIRREQERTAKQEQAKAMHSKALLSKEIAHLIVHHAR